MVINGTVLEIGDVSINLAEHEQELRAEGVDEASICQLMADLWRVADEKLEQEGHTVAMIGLPRHISDGPEDMFSNMGAAIESHVIGGMAEKDRKAPPENLAGMWDPPGKETTPQLTAE